MAFTFGAKQNNKIKPVPGTVRTERRAEPTITAPGSRSSGNQSASKVLPLNRNKSTTSLRSSHSNGQLKPPSATKRKAARQASPRTQRLVESEDEDSDEADLSVKRPREASPEDLENMRQVFLPYGVSGKAHIVHAADVQTAAITKKSALPTETIARIPTVELQYPGGDVRERYRLYGMKDQIDPWKDIQEAATFMIDHYLPTETQEAFKKAKTAKAEEDTRGPLKDLTWQIKLHANDPFSKSDYNHEALKASLERFNQELRAALTSQDHAISNTKLDPAMVRFIMVQAYERVVSPRVDSVHTKIENKNNTYGELHPQFIFDIAHKTRLRPGQTFVDLGSGVGNVVLQMALETGCDSWGWEEMPDACDVASAHKKEFIQRCRLWGVKPGAVNLKQGNFLENDDSLLQVLRKADVVLVNNEVFDTDLIQALKLLFLELKEGCRVVSLKSFASSQKERNPNDTFNNYSIREVDFLENWVSWKAGRGTYFIATKR